jgi:hypothetical protein
MNADILSIKVLSAFSASISVHPRPIFKVKVGRELVQIEIPQWFFSFEVILLKK